MAQIAVQDLIDQARYWESISGIGATRKFLVTGLSEQPEKKLFEAAACPGLPRVGQVHPGNPQLYCSNVDVSPAGDQFTTSAFVIVTYGSKSTTLTQPSASAPVTVEVGATSSNIETTVDKDGNDMWLYYTPQVQNMQGVGTPPILVSVGTIPGKEIQQPFKASVQESHPYFTMSRLEPGIFNFQKVLLYQNKVNSVPFFGGDPRTWYCAAIRATKQGNNYQVSYEFQYRAKTWNVEGIFVDPSTGAPVADPVDGDPGKGVGHASFKVLQEADFNSLNLGV